MAEFDTKTRAPPAMCSAVATLHLCYAILEPFVNASLRTPHQVLLPPGIFLILCGIISMFIDELFVILCFRALIISGDVYLYEDVHTNGIGLLHWSFNSFDSYSTAYYLRDTLYMPCPLSLHFR